MPDFLQDVRRLTINLGEEAVSVTEAWPLFFVYCYIQAREKNNPFYEERGINADFYSQPFLFYVCL